MRLAVARGLSIVGHPALLVPTAVILSVANRNAPTTALIAATGVSVIIAVSALLYGLLQVRAKRWLDVDASVPEERRQLNVFLLVALLGASVVLWSVGQPWQLAVGVAIAGAIVAVALALRSALKISLHSAFSVFAACLLWPNAAAMGLLLLLSIAIGWSRLVLHRHTFAEVVLGLLVGALAGGCLMVVSAEGTA
jgi:membrane-associated phospholipid phosphatase